MKFTRRKDNDLDLWKHFTARKTVFVQPPFTPNKQSVHKQNKGSQVVRQLPRKCKSYCLKMENCHFGINTECSVKSIDGVKVIKNSNCGMKPIKNSNCRNKPVKNNNCTTSHSHEQLRKTCSTKRSSRNVERRSIKLPKVVDEYKKLCSPKNVSLEVPGTTHIKSLNKNLENISVQGFCCCNRCKKDNLLNNCLETSELHCQMPYTAIHSSSEPELDCSDQPQHNLVKIYNKIPSPKVELQRIDEAVFFLSNLGLRPVWKNNQLFKSPVKLKRLGKFRNSSKN